MKLLLKPKTAMLSCVIAIFLISISGCDFFNTESSIEKDEREQQEILNGLFNNYWKGAKISIRSLPIDQNTEYINFEEIKKKQVKELSLGKHLSSIYDWEKILKNDYNSEEGKALKPKEFIEFAQEVYAMADAIEKLDEDDYPTFVEIIHYSSRLLQKEPVELPKGWNNSMDHWLFAMIMETRFGFGAWKTYELDRVHVQDLATSDYRVLASLHKGMDHLRNKWYFLADESFSRAIAEANNHEITLQGHTLDLLAKTKFNDSSPEEQFKQVVLAGSYLLRGFSRHQADSDELNRKAIEDIEASLASLLEMGVEDELVWMAESYVYIKNNENEKAISSLEKLQGSEYLSSKERMLIDQAKEQIRKRNPASALNFLTDKIIVYRLGLSYTMSYAAEIQWMKFMEKTEQGKKLLERFSELEQIFEKASEYLDVDKLKEESEKFIGELVK
jgi:hypothetical protein